MFYDCFNIEKINVESFDTSKVISMYHMFFCCEKIRKLDLSNFILTGVNVRSMFEGCKNLIELNIGSLFHHTPDSDYIFEECKKLKRINIGRK